MKRHLCAITLLAVALLPDWASACWRYGPGSYAASGYYAAPVYYHPAPAYYCQPVIIPCTPVMPPPMHPPRVEVPKGSSTNVPRTMPPTVVPDPVRPAGGNAEEPTMPMPVPVPPLPAKPDPAPAPIPPPMIPVPVPAPDPAPAPKLEFPKPDDKLPPLVLPKEDALKGLPVVPPKGEEVKPPVIDPPAAPGAAIPIPAPAPDTFPVPGAAPKGTDVLPPLTLPPDVPVAPDAKPEKPPTVAKSSPLTAAKELKVSVFPATGNVPPGGTFKVGFYNHTPHALQLTIDGQTVTLPARSYLHAQLPARFTWKCGDRPPTTATVPADAAGLDVLFKE